MSHKPLAWLDTDDQVRVAPMPAFWAVMLGGRDSASMVNMLPCQEKYSLPNPVAANWGSSRLIDGMFVKLTFFSNSRDIEPGELLALPFDGGSGEMICENFPPIMAISHK